MTATRHRRSALLVAFWLCLLLAPGSVLADPNATIIGGDVQLRQSYPKFEISTLFKFRLVPGPILAVIPSGSRVEVSRKRIVAKTQEWFEATHDTGARQLTGWIYAGNVSNRQYIQLDPGVEDQISVSVDGRRPAQTGLFTAAMRLIFAGSAHAQTSGGGVDPPPAETDPVRTLILGLAYVLIFIGSLIATKRWIFPSSNSYTSLTGIFVLVILGFISEKTLPDLIGKFLVP